MFVLLGGEDIAKEDLLDIFGLDARSLNGSCVAVRIRYKRPRCWRADSPLIAAAPSWVALKLDRELDRIISIRLNASKKGGIDGTGISYPKKEPTGVLAAETM